MGVVRRQIAVGAGLTLIVSCLAGISSVTSASAATVTCGQTITANTTLTADVGPCEGDGIVIGADNIVLNLNGRRVFGTEGPGDGNAAGIRLPQRTGVSIIGATGLARRMGTVTDFDAGVVINGGSGNRIGRLIIADNVSHAEADPPGSTQFTAVLGDGIAVFNSPGNVIADNTIRDNGIYDNIAILGVGANDNVIAGNRITGATGTPESPTVGLGIALAPATTFPSPEPHESLYGNQILDNVIDGNSASAISSIGNVNGMIRGNRIRSNGFGIAPNSQPTITLSSDPAGTQITNVTVEDNLISGNRGRAMTQYNFNSEPSEGSVVTNNLVVKNGLPDPDSATGNLLGGGGVQAGSYGLMAENRIIGNFGTGIYGGDSGNTIEQNTVVGNHGDGIQVINSSGLFHSNSVLGNSVHNNDGSGIIDYFGHQNQFIGNDASGNLLRFNGGSLWGYFLPDLDGGDLVHLDFGALVEGYFETGEWIPESFGCGTNIFSGNTWGAAGYFPACVTAGGTGPVSATPGAASAASEGSTASSPIAVGGLLPGPDIPSPPPLRPAPAST